MKVDFNGIKIPLSLKRKIKRAAELCLTSLNQAHKKFEIAVAIVSESEMKELNNRTRGIDKVTDVLSFPSFNLKAYDIIDENKEDNYLGKYIFIGDMAICLERATEQAKEFGWGLEDEVVKLVIHSVLHLMGFDHIKDEDYAVMSKEEEKIASKFYTNKKI